jgi:hypothetical protein
LHPRGIHNLNAPHFPEEDADCGSDVKRAKKNLGHRSAAAPANFGSMTRLALGAAREGPAAGPENSKSVQKCSKVFKL